MSLKKVEWTGSQTANSCVEFRTSCQFCLLISQLTEHASPVKYACVRYVVSRKSLSRPDKTRTQQCLSAKKQHWHNQQHSLWVWLCHRIVRSPPYFSLTLEVIAFSWTSSVDRHKKRLYCTYRQETNRPRADPVFWLNSQRLQDDWQEICK